MNLRPPGYEPPRLCTRVPPYSAEMQNRSQFSAAAVHLGGTQLHRCGSLMLAERLQRGDVAVCLSAWLGSGMRASNDRLGEGRPRARVDPHAREPGAAVQQAVPVGDRHQGRLLADPGSLEIPIRSQPLVPSVEPSLMRHALTGLARPTLAPLDSGVQAEDAYCPATGHSGKG